MLLPILFLLLSTGGALGAAFFRRRYEEMLPVTLTAIVATLFVFGLAGRLDAGVYAVCGLGLLGWALALGRAVRQRELRDFLRRLCSPGMGLFLLLFAALFLLNRGKVADEIDEYTHWVSIVKIMTLTDRFGGSPAALYASYPPGMPLLQYFFQKISLLLHPSGAFREDLLYWAYQCYLLSFLLPFASDFSPRRLSGLPLFALTAFALPLTLFSNAYTCAYIDPFLGVTAGAAFAMLLSPEPARFRPALAAAVCTLTLSKDSGLFFALALALGVGLRWLSSRREPAPAFGPGMTGLTAAAALLPKALWSLYLTWTGAVKAFPLKVDFAVALRLLLGRETGYRATVCQRFWKALFTYQIPLGDTGLSIPYLPLAALLLTGLYWLKRERIPLSPCQKALRLLPGATFTAYGLGLLGMYLFSFQDFDALPLGGMSRYFRTAFLCLVCLLALGSLTRLNAFPPERRRQAAALFFCALLLSLPWQSAWDFLSRNSVRDSQELRQPYQDMAEQVKAALPEEDAPIFCVIQSGDGYSYFVLRHLLFPYLINRGDWQSWSAQSDPSVTLSGQTLESWWRELEAGYDYVALFELSDSFADQFGGLFSGMMEEGGLYRVDREQRRLVPVLPTVNP